MAKVKVKKSELIKAKRIRNYTNRIASQNQKYISKVFEDFANQIAVDNGVKFDYEIKIKILYNRFNSAMKKALKIIFSKSVNLSSEYINNLFGWKVADKKITIIQDEVIKKYNEKNAARMVKKITASTENTLNSIITNAQSKGLNQKDVVKQIVDRVHGMSKARARTIARTETNKAVSITTNATAKGAEMKKKMWVYTHISKKVRKSHIMLDGVEVGIDDLFDIGGLYPHDPGLPPEEVINCSCIVIYK